MSASSEALEVNRLLGQIPVDEYERIAPYLKPVSLPLGEILFHPDDEIEDVYFPTNSIVSLLTSLENGPGMEVGLVGKEGFVGVSAILSGKETKLATVQATGMALKLEAGKLREAFLAGGAFQAAFLRYTHALMTQISQSVVCNVRHPVEGRLARWLLMYHDRIGRDEFELTQEFMANMLGVRRASVSQVARKLQRLGLIRYKRRAVTIVDREGLERFVCECYPVVKQGFEGVLL